ncbi:polyprenyl synthetase family protein [Microbacterium sp. NPDC056234]|uniref:polyprenyl synthetase family protein n=1 Tax=Microbacterium sp. NPDC056234 TaxID=3345757 RepID=UPI0035E1CF03
MTATLVREDLHAQIESRVRSVFDDRIARAAPYGDEYVGLWRASAEQVLGGKLLRPRLLVAMHDALLDQDTADEASATRDAVVEIAAAVEILHYAFLLHDDVIDGDAQRRGKPNLIGALRDARSDLGTTSAQHWAVTGAILMGDLLLSVVHQMFARAELDHATRLRLLDLLDHTITETVAGEHADVALSDGAIAPDLKTILTMTAHKTATYTFEFPLRVAAMLAGAAPLTEDALAAIGQHLGVAFQLQDDALSVFGDAGEHGKEPYADLREGKETVLIAYARLTSAWSSIEPRFGDSSLSADDGALISDQLRQCGADSFVQHLIDEQLAAARTGISDETAPLPAAARETLMALLDRIQGRLS